MKNKIYDIVLAARTEGVIPGKTKKLAESDTEDILEALKSNGVRAGYAHKDTEAKYYQGIKASASDGHLYFLGDIADNLFEQMKEKDGYLVFIPKDAK
ncbi:hypothetical protein LCGC14_2347640 [marine sediment metagenome]|uniref:Uncharacterized protein n=1 Tax=marine sediment metagenome TaxID=412755 RepID=A0A0F9CAW9_9ZZZZ